MCAPLYVEHLPLISVAVERPATVVLPLADQREFPALSSDRRAKSRDQSQPQPTRPALTGARMARPDGSGFAVRLHVFWVRDVNSLNLLSCTLVLLCENSINSFLAPQLFSENLRRMTKRSSFD